MRYIMNPGVFEEKVYKMLKFSLVFGSTHITADCFIPPPHVTEH